jgi:hypothetical protein
VDSAPADSGDPAGPERSPRAQGLRLLVIGLAIGAVVLLAISKPALHYYGGFLNHVLIQILAAILSSVSCYSVALVLIGLVLLVTGKSLKEASNAWDQLEGYERGFLGCGIVALVVFLIVKIGLFWASLP